MIYLIIILLSLILIILGVIFYKVNLSSNSTNLTDISGLEKNINSLLELSKKNDINNVLTANNITNIDSKTNKLNDFSLINSKDNENILKNINNLTEMLNNEKEQNSLRQQDLERIKFQIQNITDLMLNTKHRGTFGEYQLNNLMSVYCGDNTTMWESQYHLKNGTIGDVALHLPNEKDKVLIIDSKFPMENYIKLVNYDGNDIKNPYISPFKNDIKKHITDISKKYINSQTVEQAIMFIPSESIYHYICSQCSDLFEESYKKKVLITSPTTLIGVTFTLVNITKEFQRNQNLKAIEKNIINLKTETERLVARADKVDKSLTTASNAMKDLNITCNKINNKIEKMYDGYDENN